MKNNLHPTKARGGNEYEGLIKKQTKCTIAKKNNEYYKTPRKKIIKSEQNNRPEQTLEEIHRQKVKKIINSILKTQHFQNNPRRLKSSEFPNRIPGS